LKTGQTPGVAAAEQLFVSAALAPSGLAAQTLAVTADRAATPRLAPVRSAASDRTPGAGLAAPDEAAVGLMGDQPGRPLWRGPKVKAPKSRGDWHGGAEDQGDEPLFMPMSSGSGSGSGWGSGSGSGSGSGEEPVAGPRLALSTGYVIDPSVPFVPEEIDNYGSNTSDITTTVENWVEDDVSYTATIVDDWTLIITATAGPNDLWSYDESLISVYTVSIAGDGSYSYELDEGSAGGSLSGSGGELISYSYGTTAACSAGVWTHSGSATVDTLGDALW
jgi:hypothetical protein